MDKINVIQSYFISVLSIKAILSPSIKMSESNFLGLSTAMNAVLFVLLTLLAGIMAGLIMCTFSLDVKRLRGLAQGSNYKDAKKAEQLIELLQEPHWVLITFLIWNDIALEMMPLLLDAIFNPVLAVVMSVMVTLVFCELIPQAIFLHHAFSLCAFLAPLTHLLMYACCPIAWPIAKLLDYLVGEEKTVSFRRRELKALISYQEELRGRKRSMREESVHSNSSSSDEDDLEKEEMTIMFNVLSLSENKAKNMVQTPIEDMYKLHYMTYITVEIVETIFQNGYNFILVYENEDEPNNVGSFFLPNHLTSLIYRDQDELIRVCDLHLIPLPRMGGETIGTDVFVGLQRLSPAIALIVDEESNKPKGVLTLRNVTELIHQTTFTAEMDPTHESPMQVMMHSWKLFRKHDDDAIKTIPSLPGSFVHRNKGREEGSSRLSSAEKKASPR